MSAALLSPMAAPRAPLEDPKFLFSAEARERIRQLPSTTPVPLFHSRSIGLVSPSASVTSSIYSASSSPVDPASVASQLHRPQPRSPHDASAWEQASQHVHGAHFAHPFGLHGYAGSSTSAYGHSAVYDAGGTYPATGSSNRAESGAQSAPFFASLAKHAPMLPLLPALSSGSPHPRLLPHSVGVYERFDKQWMSTPIPKALASHPMAIAHAEASRRREEWERAEEERRQRLLWEQQQTAAEGRGPDEGMPPAVKKTGAAKLGKRPALNSRRAPSALFATPSSSDGVFRTPLPRVKQRSAVSASSSSAQKRRIAPLRVDEKEGQKEDLVTEHKSADAKQHVSRSNPLASPRRSPPPDGDDTEDDDEREADAAETAGPDESGDDDNDTGEAADDGSGEGDAEDEDTDDATESRRPLPTPSADERTSNRMYPAASSTPAPSASSSSPLPLKPDLTLSRWFLHVKPSNPSASLLLKGLTPLNEPWVTGVVLERVNAHTLLTNSRRYVLVGAMDEDEMRAEGWDEAGLRAFVRGFPTDWRERVDKELERRAQRTFEYEEAAEAKEGRKRDVVAPSTAPSSARPHRSPAPLKTWKSEEWSEAETLRLVEAQLLHEATGGRALWRLVAADVGNDRTGEECRRRFEDVKREQQATIRLTEKAHASPSAVGVATSPHNNSPARRGKVDSATKPPSAPLHASRSSSSSAVTAKPRKPIPSPIKRTVKVKQKETPKEKSKEQPRPTPAKVKAPARRTSASYQTPLRVAPPSTPSTDSAAVNPHEIALSVSRRSGRAVIAPLKWWEMEREVNGVVMRGNVHLNSDEYRAALTEKEKRDRERRDDGGRWSSDERHALFLAYKATDPTESRFWEEVASRLHGRTADECQREFQALYPTPKRRGKRRPVPDDAVDEEKDGGADVEDDGARRARKRKRVTTLKREVRQALAQRDADHNGDDLFDSTPFKQNMDVAAPSHPSNRRALPDSTAETRAHDGDEVVLVGDAGYADAVVQRLVKERRKTRVNRGRVQEDERRRRDGEEEKRRQGDRFAETADEVRHNLRQLDQEQQRAREQRMDEMDDEDGDEGDESE